MKINLKKAFLTTFAMLGLGLVLGSASAQAADMCFLDDYNSTLVAKSFSFPAAGSCKAVNGYELGSNGCIITGTACGTSDNGYIRFNLSTTCSNVPYNGTANFWITRVNSGYPQAGYGSAAAPNFENNTWVRSLWHIRTIPCPNPRPVQ
jgi:hypothetical protein